MPLSIFAQNSITDTNNVFLPLKAKQLFGKDSIVEQYTLTDNDFGKILNSSQIYLKISGITSDNEIFKNLKITFKRDTVTKEESFYNITDSIIKKLRMDVEYLIIAINEGEKKKFIKVIFKENDSEEKFDYLKNLHYTVYTDFKGYSNEPNGLVQNEISFNVPFLKWEIKSNKDCFGCLKKENPEIKELCNTMTFFDNVKAKVNFFQTQSDSSNHYRKLNYDTTGSEIRKHIHTLDLIKYANISAYINVNVFKWQHKKTGLRFFLDGFASFYNTPIIDSVITKKTNSITSIGYGYSVKLKFKPDNSHIMADFSYAQTYFKLFSNDVLQRTGSLYEDGNVKNNFISNSSDNNERSIIGLFTGELRYSSKVNKLNDLGTGYFLRLNVFTNPIIGEDSKYNYNNNYVQIQFGINKSIDELLKFLSH